MEKDRRYILIKSLIAAGHIKSFRGIFELVPKSVVARDLGMNNTRFTRLMENVDQFTLGELFVIAALVEVDELTILNLCIQQYLADKKKKTK